MKMESQERPFPTMKIRKNQERYVYVYIYIYIPDILKLQIRPKDNPQKMDQKFHVSVGSEINTDFGEASLNFSD